MSICIKTGPAQNYSEIGLAEELDYWIDYTDTLALVSPPDTISTSSWAKVGNVVLGVESNNDQKTWQWVTVATARIGEVVRLINTVVTNGGRTHVRVLYLKVANRPGEVIVDELDIDVL